MGNVELTKLTALVDPVLSREGYELVDLEWKREPQGWVLRVFIDRDGGVALEHCADVSHLLSPTLDVSNLIPVRYHLEVSSPGLNRPLKKEADFVRFVGHKARVRTRRPIRQAKGPVRDAASATAVVDGRRNFAGTLLGVEEGLVRIDVGDQICQVPVTDVEKAHLVYEFKGSASADRA